MIWSEFYIPIRYAQVELMKSYFIRLLTITCYIAINSIPDLDHSTRIYQQSTVIGKANNWSFKIIVDGLVRDLQEIYLIGIFNNNKISYVGIFVQELVVSYPIEKDIFIFYNIILII